MPSGACTRSWAVLLSNSGDSSDLGRKTRLSFPSVLIMPMFVKCLIALVAHAILGKDDYKYTTKTRKDTFFHSKCTYVTFAVNDLGFAIRIS